MKYGVWFLILFNLLTSCWLYPEPDKEVITFDRYQNSTVGLNEASDNFMITFQHSGNANWSGYTVSGAVGNDALVSGEIQDNQSSIISFSEYCSAIQFKWKVSSESGFDFLQFFIDNVKVDEISGEIGWQEKSFNIIAGTHDFKWVYMKDASADVGLDLGMVDNIVLIGTQITNTNSAYQTNNIMTTNYNLYGEWLFEGNFLDSSTNFRHGTSFNGGYFTNDRNGNAYGAFYFDGQDDYVRIPHIGNTPEGSFEVWFLSKEDGSDSYDQIFSQTENFQITLRLGQLWYRQNSTGGGSYNNINTTYTINPDTWYHMVCTWDGSLIKMYLNSELIAQTSCGHPISPATSYAYFGRWGQLNDHNFNGIIDDFKIYNYTMDATEVTNRYNDNVSIIDHIPSISISIPTQNANYVINQDISISGIASDDFGLDTVYIYSGAVTNILSSGLDSWNSSMSFANAGTHTISVRAMDISNKLSIVKTVDVIITNSNTMDISVSEALDWYGHDFVFTGDADWTFTTLTTYYDGDAMMSGDISDSQFTAITTTITNVSNGYLVKFWWKSSSESGWDYMQCLVDGSLEASISGEQDWIQASVLVPVGIHNITWKYMKDSSVSSGLDTAWLDKVEMVPQAADTTLPTIDITSPAYNQTNASSSVTISGTSSDNVGVVKVYLSDSWTTNVITVNPENWSHTVTGLSHGGHAYWAWSEDSSGNQSAKDYIFFYTIPPDGTPDSSEPNEDFASAKTLTPAADHYRNIHNATDEDFFKVIGSSFYPNFTITLSDIPNDVNYQLEVYNKNFQLVDSSYRMGFLTETCNIVNSDPGTYFYIRVFSANLWSAANYKLRVDWAP